MFASTHHSHGDPDQPYVAMNQTEAREVARALERAINAAPRDGEVRVLLQFFQEHCKAHGFKYETLTYQKEL